MFFSPSCSVEAGCSVPDACPRGYVRACSTAPRLALLPLPVVSHPPPRHRLLLRCGRRFGTCRDADNPLVGVKVGRHLGAVDVD